MNLADLYDDTDTEAPEAAWPNTRGQITASERPTFSLGNSRYGPDGVSGGSTNVSVPVVPPDSSPSELFIPQADLLQMTKLQNGLAEARNAADNGEINPFEYTDYEKQILPRLLSLTARQRKADEASKQKALQDMRDAHQEALSQSGQLHAATQTWDREAAKHDAAGIPDRVIPYTDPLTGDVMHLIDNNGKIEELKWEGERQRDQALTDLNTMAEGGDEEGGATLPMKEAAVGAMPITQQTTQGNEIGMRWSEPKPETMEEEGLRHNREFARTQKPWDYELVKPQPGFAATPAQKAAQAAKEGRSNHPTSPYHVSTADHLQAVKDTAAQKEGLPHSYDVTDAQMAEINRRAYYAARGDPKMTRDFAHQLLESRREENKRGMLAQLAKTKGATDQQTMKEIDSEHKRIENDMRQEKITLQKAIAKETDPEKKLALENSQPAWHREKTLYDREVVERTMAHLERTRALKDKLNEKFGGPVAASATKAPAPEPVAAPAPAPVAKPSLTKQWLQGEKAKGGTLGPAGFTPESRRRLQAIADAARQPGGVGRSDYKASVVPE